MPLKSGGSKSAVSFNIKELMSSGRSQRQAVAISLSHAGYPKKSKRSSSRKAR